MSKTTTLLLLRPHRGDLSWQADAECRRDVYRPEMWFPVSNQGPARTETEEAKAICARCPSMEPCKEWALDVLEFGVAGGMDEEERRAERRRRARERAGVAS